MINDLASKWRNADQPQGAALNKYTLFKQIRGELAESCFKELRALEELLHSGISVVSGGGAAIEISAANSLTAMSESGQIFRSEMAEATRLILERYQKNLRKEMAALGLSEVQDHIPPADGGGHSELHRREWGTSRFVAPNLGGQEHKKTTV